MFGKIKNNKAIRETLSYHRQKECQKQAECLTAVNFVKDLTSLSYADRVHHFDQLTSLRESITRAILHISLSFHPHDMLSNDDMTRIAERYMQQLRLHNQPYLVYRHYDRPHPHMHIVSTSIDADGNYLGISRKDCHEARVLVVELEKEFRLTQSGEWRRQKHTVGQALRVQYDKMTTMHALTNVLDKVLPLYKCTTMDELNAILRLYNVEAYAGQEDSHLHQHRGLVYRILDDTGKPMASPVKASHFDSKPTLPNLEKRFEQNQAEVQRQLHRQRVTVMLEWNMTKRGLDLPGLEKAMERQRISIVRMKENVFYVDHETKAVFDGEKLGEKYNVQALRQRLTPVEEQKQTLRHRQRHHHTIMHDL